MLKKLTFLSVLGLCALIIYVSLITISRPSSMTSDLSETPSEGVPFSPPSPTQLPPSPSSYVIPFRSHVYQSFNNCGPASLSMLLSYFDLSLDQEMLADKLRPYHNPQGIYDDKSVGLDELAAFVSQYDLVAYHRPGGTLDTVRTFVAQGYPVLVRTWTTPTEDIGHFRVIRGYDDVARIVIQDDSLQGKDISIGYEDFLKMWEPFAYEYVVVVPQIETTQATSILGPDSDEAVAWRRVSGDLERQLTQGRKGPHILLSLSRATYHLSQYDESVRYFELAESQLPARTLWYQTEPILAYFKVGDHDRVFQLVRAVVESGNPAVSELYYLRGRIYEQMSNRDAARREYDLAITYHSTYLPALEARARLK